MACKDSQTSKQSNISAIGVFDFRLPVEAPVFHPTVEEFKDPLGYINKIRPVAEKSGICKIKPPPNWQPPFTVNVDEFKFTPRIQRLNELEAKTRIKLNYLDQIAKFWELQGSSLKIPQVDKKVLDIYTLHMMVKSEGGVDAVTNKKMWNKIATKMGWPSKSSIGPWLKMQYDKILYPFDVFQEMKSVKETNDTDNKNDEELGDDFKMAGSDAKKVKLKQKPKSKKAKTDIDPLAKYICRHCFRGDSEASMLLCDGCDDSYHTFCLMPPLVEIPKGDWRCPKCVAVEVSKPVEAFGFEQAQREYTLQQFGEMADQFKCDYFNLPVHMVPLSLVEREFWRVVSSIDEDVIVEYGADLHTMDHGSGFPTKATDVDKKDEAYTNSGWNLNNIPVLPGSVLGHINADISGMKVPWMYVGMCFATFCWHNEDHWSYSINYLHWGEAKTWYGVPGCKAEEFEEVMKKAAPELFQSQPDLLHQLVTIMNPNILMDAGVPVCRTDQQAGEFVVTFPRAYHAGFNQGYNFAEAVNFAPADWLPMGRECISHYSTLRRFCVFSHDELVCGMASQAECLDLHISNATLKDMLKMVENESNLRETLFEWGCSEAEKEHFELVPDDERQCDVCKTTCFLSAITCPCDKDRLVCLKHFKDLCNCDPSRHKLRYRYTLDELPELLDKLRKRGEIFEKWIDAVQSAVVSDSKNKTGLEVFKKLVNEAKEINIPECDLMHNLEAIIKEGEKCAEVIRQMCFCKLGRPRPESLNNIYLPLDELIKFYDQVLELACAIPGTDTLKKFIEKYTKFRDQTKVLLNKKYPPIEELENTLEVGETLEFAIQETAQLKQYLSLVKWLEGVKEKRAHTQSLTKDVICNLLQEGITFLPQDDVEVQIRELQHLVAKIDSWEEAAKQCLLGKQLPSAVGLKAMVEEGKKIPAYVRNLDTICEIFKKVQVWFAKVNYYKANKVRLYVDTIDKLVLCAKSLPIRIDALPAYEEQLLEARAWQDKLEKTFLKKNSRYTLLEVLSPRVKWDEVPYLERPCTKEESFLETEPFLPVGIDLHGKREPADVVAEFKKAEELEFHNIKEIRAKNSKKWEDGLQTKDFCICGGSKKKDKIFQCSLCLDCFHEDCVPNVKPQAKFRSMCTSQDLLSIWQGRFLCPNCARSRRPRLDTLIGPLVQLQKIPTRIPEGEALQCLLERAMSWQVKVKKILATEEFASALTLISELAQKFVQAAAKQKTEKIILDELEKCDKRSGTNKHITENFNTVPTPKAQLCPQINVQKSTSSECSKTDTSYNFCGQEKGGNVDKTKPLITLSSSAQKLLEDLLLEWDLMELSLDEGLYLSRIHQASNFSREQIEQVARLQFREAGNRTFAYLYTCKTPKTLQSEPRQEKDGESSKRKLRPTTKRKTKLEGTPPQLKKKCIKPLPRTIGEAERKEDEEDCASPRCLRPVGLSVDWVQCDGCQSWFHLYCLGLHRRDVKPNEDFLCEGCKVILQQEPKPSSSIQVQKWKPQPNSSTQEERRKPLPNTSIQAKTKKPMTNNSTQAKTKKPMTNTSTQAKTEKPMTNNSTQAKRKKKMPNTSIRAKIMKLMPNVFNQAKRMKPKLNIYDKAPTMLQKLNISSEEDSLLSQPNIFPQEQRLLASKQKAQRLHNPPFKAQRWKPYPNTSRSAETTASTQETKRLQPQPDPRFKAQQQLPHPNMFSASDSLLSKPNIFPQEQRLKKERTTSKQKAQRLQQQPDPRFKAQQQLPHTNMFSASDSLLSKPNIFPQEQRLKKERTTSKQKAQRLQQQPDPRFKAQQQLPHPNIFSAPDNLLSKPNIFPQEQRLMEERTTSKQEAQRRHNPPFKAQRWKQYANTSRSAETTASTQEAQRLQQQPDPRFKAQQQLPHPNIFSASDSLLSKPNIFPQEQRLMEERTTSKQEAQRRHNPPFKTQRWKQYANTSRSAETTASTQEAQRLQQQPDPRFKAQQQLPHPNIFSASDSLLSKPNIFPQEQRLMEERTTSKQEAQRRHNPPFKAQRWKQYANTSRSAETTASTQEAQRLQQQPDPRFKAQQQLPHPNIFSASDSLLSKPNIFPQEQRLMEERTTSKQEAQRRHNPPFKAQRWKQYANTSRSAETTASTQEAQRLQQQPDPRFKAQQQLPHPNIFSASDSLLSKPNIFPQVQRLMEERTSSTHEAQRGHNPPFKAQLWKPYANTSRSAEKLPQSHGQRLLPETTTTTQGRSLLPETTTTTQGRSLLPWLHPPSETQGGRLLPWLNPPSETQGGRLLPWLNPHSETQGGRLSPWLNPPSETQGGRLSPWLNPPSETQGGRLSPWLNPPSETQGRRLSPWLNTPSETQGRRLSPWLNPPSETQGRRLSPWLNPPSETQGRRLSPWLIPPSETQGRRLSPWLNPLSETQGRRLSPWLNPPSETENWDKSSHRSNDESD